MSVIECVTKLVATGQISRAIGDEALDLYTRSKGEYAKTMGPAQAEAAAGLAAARAMQAGARKLKNDAAKQALGFANFERTALEHPDGPIAGVMDQMVQSLRGRGTRNVDTVREDIWATLAAKFGDAMTKYAPGILGVSKEQVASARNLIREVFGVSTGDNIASSAGKAWADVKAYAEDRARAAGRNFEPNENWRVPQPWRQEQVAKVNEEEFARDFRDELHKGGLLRLWDRDTGKPAAADRTDFILSRAYRDITTTGGGGTFAKEMRTFEFAPGEAGAEAWLRLQQKYGVGDNIFGMLTGHMQNMASEIALAEVIAPNHRAAIAAMMPVLKAADRKVRGIRRFNPVRVFETPLRVQQTYDVLTGRANAVDGPVLAGVLGGLRSLSTASNLKNAVISSVPGDTVTALMASSYNGMPATRMLSGVFRELARGGEESKAIAARMNLVAHSAMEYGHGYRFFQDQIAGPAQLRWLATTMIRAQGLQAWTELIKRTFTMEFMGHLADHAAYDLANLAKVNKPLAAFLDRYQITAKEWDTLRKAGLMDVDGARFLDTSTLKDQRLAEKLRTAVIQERRFAMLEPDARIRAITTGGLPQGTFLGEVARNLFLFKSFSLTMAATHMMRVATQESAWQMVKYGLPLVLFSTIAGAVSMQAKSVLAGKDPQKMSDPKFWAQALAQGGGLGIYGDLLNSAYTRTGRSPIAEFAGPIPAMGEDVARILFKPQRDLAAGKPTTVATELTRVGRRYTPGTWYTKLAVDRLLWDTIQTAVDPDYRGSFRRIEDRARKDTGQQFWFEPGQAAPSRAPNLGAALQ